MKFIFKLCTMLLFLISLVLAVGFIYEGLDYDYHGYEEDEKSFNVKIELLMFGAFCLAATFVYLIFLVSKNFLKEDKLIDFKIQLRKLEIENENLKSQIDAI